MSTIACLTSGRQRAAIATIQVKGPRAREIVAQNFRPTHSRPIACGEVRYGVWHGGNPGDGDNISESVVVTTAHERTNDGGPNLPFLDVSSEVPMWEIHCHGGTAAIQRILDNLSATGATIVDSEAWQEACLWNRLQREANTALSHATTTRTAAIVLDQVRGAMQDFVLRSQAEVESKGSNAIASIQREASSIWGLRNFGLHLTKPWTIVLAGAPNVGKSSLINALVGYQRSITMDQPGTTRDVLQADAVIDGWPLSLCDTAGIREIADNEIEQQGVQRAKRIAVAADLVIWVRDATADPETDAACPLMSLDSTAVLIVCNKIDLCQQKNVDHMIPTSATTGTGIETLRRAIIERLIPEVPVPGIAVPICERQINLLGEIMAAGDVEILGSELQRLVGSA